MHKWRVYQPFLGYLERNQQLINAGFTVCIVRDYSQRPPNHWFILAEHENRSAMTMYLLGESADEFHRVEEIEDA
jgi:hypothetical protein